MHTALLERSLEGLRAVRRHISFSAKLRAQVGQPSFGCNTKGEKCFDIKALLGEAPDSTSWRVIDHCTAISRAYALFEAFVEQLLREYLAFLARSYKLSELGEEFMAKYTRGIGRILINQNTARYENIDVASLIADATTALSSKSPYQIQPEAMLRAEQNFRMAELQRIFSHCGLAGLESWVAKHSAIEAFFATQSRLSDTAESELKEIVEYRNEAAHGDVDQVLGTDVLVEVTDFFEALLQSITDFVQYDTLRRAKELGKAQVIGIISERLSGNIVIAKIANSSIRIGDTVYINGKGLTMIGKIQSIHLDDVNHDAADITDEREVGLSLGVRAKKGCELIRLS